MKNWEQFLEDKKYISGETQAIVRIVRAIRDAFQDLSRMRRKSAWKAVCSDKGKQEIALLINNPNRSLARLRHLRTVREDFNQWMESNSDLGA